MYKYQLSEGLDKPTIRQHGDFVVIEKNWCPELKKIRSDQCTTYDPGEILKSHSEVGHLTPDVVLAPAGMPGPNVKINCSYLIIRDFGVDWRHFKEAPKAEPLFQAWRARFEIDKSLLFRIVGYNDCVGPERHNLHLRTGRARNAYWLLGPRARSRVMSVAPAPAGTYLTDNSTIAGRANNRAVVIEFFVNPPVVI